MSGGAAAATGGMNGGKAGMSGAGAGGAGAGGKGGAGAGGAGAGAGGKGGAGGASGGGSGGSGGATMGCGMSGAATGVMSAQSITVGNQTRTYVLSVPASYNSSNAYRLVFAWHGLGGTGTLARAYFGVEGQSGGTAIFVYPNGLPLANQGNQPGWDLGASGIDVQLFDALLASVSSRYCINQARIFSTGHSFGGFFTNRLACSRGNVLRAIAPVAGAPPSGMTTCTGGVGAWIAHGMADDTVPFTSGEATRSFWLSRNACQMTTMSVTPTPCIAHNACTADLPLHWCPHAGGHEWPSFAAGGIWSFFASFN
jgi:poly(3-hydroxybutyrate) depolymerase